MLMGDERTQALKLIGGRDEATGGWQMHAFDTGDDPGRMSLSVHDEGRCSCRATASAAGCDRPRALTS